MSKWYDRKGKLIATADIYEDKTKWIKEMGKVEKMLRNPKYKIVKQQHLWWGGWLSTVWLGLDHRFLQKGKPLIF